MARDGNNGAPRDAEIGKQTIGQLADTLSKIGSQSSLKQKVDALDQVCLRMMAIFSESLANPDEVISAKDLVVISNAISGLMKNVYGSLFKMQELENKNEVDFHHPKFQRGMVFLMELVVESLRATGFQKNQIDEFLREASVRMMGMEDKLNASMKGISQEMVPKLANPLTNPEGIHGRPC